MNACLKFIAPILSATILASCSSTPVIPKIDPPIYPPPPAEARYIYEATIRSSNNISEPSFADKLQEIATGTRIAPTGLAKPYGVAVHKGRVYVTDTQQRAIVMFDLLKGVVKFIGTEKTGGAGVLRKPLGIDISRDNEIFVADNTAKRIVVFDLEGKFLRAFGNKNILTRPVGIATDPTSDRVYVVDTGGIETENHYVLVFDGKSGKHLETLGKRGRGDDGFNLPLQAATNSEGTLYVVDGGNFRVKKISKDGKFLNSFGSIGRRMGQFSRPKGIATDKNNNIYVVDTAFGNVQIFNSNDDLLLFLGERATADGPGKYSLPAGVDVDEEGKIYIVDQFFRKVDIIRPINSKPYEIFLR